MILPTSHALIGNKLKAILIVNYHSMFGRFPSSLLEADNENDRVIIKLISLTLWYSLSLFFFAFIQGVKKNMNQKNSRFLR